MTSRIYLCSDMHHEIWGLEGPVEVPDGADIVVIAGDLEYMPKALEICGKTADKMGLPVVFVPGNHEYYHRDYQAMNELANIYEHDNVHVLINRSVVLNDIRFVGTPLWSNFLGLGDEAQEIYMEAAQRYINDFRMIKLDRKSITAEMMLDWHREARCFLEAELSKPYNGKTVVVTHFPPSYQLCHPRFIGEQLSPYFNASCDDLIEKHQPTAWFYGHTHAAVENHRDYQAMNEQANIYEHDNVHVLINRSVVLNDIRFVGTPLWSNFLGLGDEAQEIYMEAAQRYINDFRMIKLDRKSITAEMMLDWHREARCFLEAELSKPYNGKTVVVTHFPPSYQLCHPRFIGEQLSPYFNASCDDLIEKYQPTAWFYGHTHAAVEKEIHGVPMFSNMGGYPGERRQNPKEKILL